MRPPVLLVHGYSDAGTSMAPWRARLEGLGFDARALHVATWRSLANELTLADIAEAFDRALASDAGLGDGTPFSVVAHSAGALVVRAWLAADPGRRRRLVHFVGLGPAHFGSPLAHKGRSFVGALVKGNRDLGEDFLEVGDRILEGLELASAFTWDLAHRDLLAADGGWLGDGAGAPWAYGLAGTGQLDWLSRRVAGAPGSDGVVRWAGSALDARKLVVDLSARATERVRVLGTRARDVPLAFVAGRHHGALLSRPTGALADMVGEALAVADVAGDAAWRARWVGRERPGEAWQQLFVRVRDERGDDVPDYHLQFEAVRDDGTREALADVASDVHANGRAPALRMFHVRLRDVRRTRLAGLRLRVLARTNSSVVGYRGVGGTRRDGWDGALDLSAFGARGDAGVQLFWPFTTTLLEVVLDREPLPYEGRNQVLWFEGGGAAG